MIEVRWKSFQGWFNKVTRWYNDTSILDVLLRYMQTKAFPWLSMFKDWSIVTLFFFKKQQVLKASSSKDPHNQAQMVAGTVHLTVK